MSETREALLQAVLAAPGDDAPRLVLADYLSEHGEPERGEFIVIECRLATDDPYTAAWRELAKRRYELFKANGSKWLRAITRIVHSAWFGRGFVDLVSVRTTQLPDKLARARELEPIQGVRLLRFTDPPDPEAIRLVMASPALVGISRIEAGDRALGPELLPAAVGDMLCGLESLHLGGNDLTSGHAELIARNNWPRLRELNLDHNHIEGVGLALIAHSHGLPALRKLSVVGCDISDDGLISLAGSRMIAQLEALSFQEFRRDAISERGVLAILRAPGLRALRTLRMASRDGMGDVITELAASPVLDTIERLEVVCGYGTGIGDDAIAAFAASPRAAALRHLSLPGAAISDAGAKSILESESLARLGHLELKNNPIESKMQTALRRRYGPSVCVFSR